MNTKYITIYQKSMKPIHLVKHTDIHVASFNIRCIHRDDFGLRDYRVRMPYIRKVLEEMNPEVIGFQEVKIEQFKYLKSILKGYDYEYCGRDTTERNEANPVFYKKSRFKKINNGTFWLSGTYQVLSNTFHSSCPRICSYLHLKEIKSKKEFVVFNTHLDHINQDARIKGVKLIKRLVKKFKYDKYPHLIIGDMNDFYGSEPIKELLKGYIDASKFKHQEKLITFHNYGRAKQKIDYIALSKDIKLLDYQVITKKFKNNIYPSDHYPIVVKIKLV